MHRLMHRQEGGGTFRKTLSEMRKGGGISLPSGYSQALFLLIRDGFFPASVQLDLPESVLAAGIQPPVEGLDPSTWPAAFSRAKNGKQHAPCWSLEPAHKSL